MAFIKQRFGKILSVLVILILGVVAMTMLGSTEKHSNKRDLKPEVRTVNVNQIEFGDYTLKVNGNGIINPQKTLNYISEANGRVLFAKNDLKNGTYVDKGELIVKLDSREIENTLYSLRSDFLNTLASVIPDFKVEEKDVYQKWYSYFKSIDINEEIPPLPEITNSQEKIMVSSRNIFKKFYDVKNQEILLSKYEIKAPFDGFVESMGIIENSYVSRGQQLFTLKDVKNLEISVPLLVEEANLLNLNSNPIVKISSDNTTTTLTGRVVRRETNLERNSQALNVYVNFINSNLDPNFLPGNYVNVNIEGRHLSEVAVIPRHLIRDNNGIYIMRNGKLAEEFVEVVAYQEDNAIISKNIENNTTLVTTILKKPLIGIEIQTTEQALAEKDNKEDSVNTLASAN